MFILQRYVTREFCVDFLWGVWIVPHDVVLDKQGAFYNTSIAC